MADNQPAQDKSQDAPPETDEIEAEYILSLCWDSGSLAAAIFNLTTLELMVMNETTDLRPDHIQLRNLFRQIQPTFLVASASNKFLEELVGLLDLPEGTDINKFKVNKLKNSSANTSNVTFYPFSLKNQQEGFRKRIYMLDLPGLPADCDPKERQVFIDSMFPLNSELTVLTLGNLLKYLHENYLKWRHVFLQHDRNPIITNVLVFHMEAQVLLDDCTFNSLNIFSNVYHPSSFKTQVRRDGLSIFNMLNECSSSLGAQELKAMLKQPIRDILQLKLRFATIEWCLKQENFDHVVTLRGYLKNLLNINLIVSRIVVNHGRTNDWKSLKKTIYFASVVCETCAMLNKDSIRSTILQELAEFTSSEMTVKQILFTLDKIIDLEGIEEKKRFYVKEGSDAEIDAAREALDEIKVNFMDMQIDDTFRTQSNLPDAFLFVYFGEMGFVVATEVNIQEIDVDLLRNNNIELLLATTETAYFRSPNCNVLNELYKERLASLIEREMKVFNQLMKFINENLAELANMTKQCAKLDVLISFASASVTYNLVKPNITMSKELVIVNGRHPLVERITKYVPSTTIINDANMNYINIITAPNASGKSIYMRQIAIICYLAHIGMFVPADEATVPLLHSIYTRIYAPESVYQNESAFMSDLQQMSKVVMNSTDRSLILVDEFGKGTHYRDGIALLAASIDHFIGRGNLTPLAFITTHYEQIQSLIESRENINFVTIETQKNDSGVFESLYKITDTDTFDRNQQHATEFPESTRILTNIFEKDGRFSKCSSLNDSYSTAIKCFIVVLAKMILKRGSVTHEFIEDLTSKIDIENFVDL